MKKIIISVMCILLMTGCGKKKETTTSPQKTEESSAVAEQKEEVTLDHITASYEGETDEGIFIQKGCKGLTVMAYYSDGTSKETTDYQLSVPTKLEAAKTYTFTVKSQGHSATFDVTCTTPFDKEAYKEKCEVIPYDELARYPDKYEGKDIVLYGRVLQIMEGDDNRIQMRIATKDSGSGNWYDDVVFGEYVYENGEGRILEDDMISVYGPYYGLFTYTSTSGSKITVPGIVIKAVGNEAITPPQEEASSSDFEEFKKKMDDYEAFFDSYVEFMKSYDATDMTMLTKYIDMLSKYTDAMNALDAIDESQLTPQEDAYYLEVMLRIEKKLLEVVDS